MANDKDFVIKNAIEVGADTKVTLGTISSSDIDLATGNYFADTLSANTTYTISNAGGVQSFQLEVTGGLVSSWNVNSASYVRDLRVSSYQTYPTGIYFKPDGTKMYITGLGTYSVDEWDLSTAWDISTASYNQEINLGGGLTQPKGLFFKPEGDKLYIPDSSGDDINEYTLSTSWDISTAAYSQSFSVSSQDTSPTSVFLKPDGTKMYVLGDSGNDVNEYDLSTAWDISTASYSQNFSVSGQETELQGLFFKYDGTKMYVLGEGGDDVNEYDLSTAWDISTASYGESFSIASQEAEPQGIYIAPTGGKMYIIGRDNDKVYQYVLESAATITWPSSIEWAGGVAPSAPASGETDVFTIVTDDGGTSYVGVKTADNLS